MFLVWIVVIGLLVVSLYAVSQIFDLIVDLIGMLLVMALPFIAVIAIVLAILDLVF